MRREMQDTCRLYTDLAWLWPMWGDAATEYAHYCQHVTGLIGQLSPPPERFWVGTVETFERSNCHTLPNAVMFSGYQVSWLKPRF